MKSSVTTNTGFLADLAMVIDSSALIAILLNEAQRERFLDLILEAESRLLSAATAVEAGIVLEYRSSPIAIR